MLDNGDSTATQKSLIFIIEEFNQFTSHPWQTLLYNLLEYFTDSLNLFYVESDLVNLGLAETLRKPFKRG